MAKRAAPASQASGQAPERPRRPQAAPLCAHQRGRRWRAPAGERRLAASEDLRRKGLKHLTHTRSDEIRCTTTLERVEPHTSEEQLALEPQSFCKHGSEQNTCPLRLRTHTSQEIFSFLVCPSVGGALFSPHFMRWERASDMHSTAPNTQTCLLSVHFTCYNMDGDVPATWYQKGVGGGDGAAQS